MRKHGRTIVFALLLLLVPVLANAWTLTVRVNGPSSAGKVTVTYTDTLGNANVSKEILAGTEYVQVKNGTNAVATVTTGTNMAADVYVDYAKQAGVGPYSIEHNNANHNLTINFATAANKLGNVKVNKIAGGTVLLQYNGTSSMTEFTNLVFDTKIGVKVSPRTDYKVTSITVADGAQGSTTYKSDLASTDPLYFAAPEAGQAVTVSLPVTAANMTVTAAYSPVYYAKPMLSAPLKAVAGKSVTVNATGTTSNTNITYAFEVKNSSNVVVFSRPASTNPAYTFIPTAAGVLEVTLTIPETSATKTATINVVSEGTAYNNLCTGCHTGSTPAIIEAYNAGTHGSPAVSCVTCHTSSPHATVANSEIVADANGFVGAATCAKCHSSIHGDWEKSFHTLKATYGPAFEGQSAGNSNIHPWVQANWTNKTMAKQLLPHAILAKVGSELIISKEEYAIDDVAIVVGQTRKQRYAVYDDGAGRTKAWVAYTTNGGIRWDIKTVEGTAYKRDGSGGTPVEVSWAGDKNRAGYKFLMIEVDLTKTTPEAKANNYGEHRSWQERCISCHVTGFDAPAWNAAKAKYVAGDSTQPDLKDLFVADIRIACEACHGPGGDHAITGDKTKIISPANLTGETRKMVCNQCHTRSDSNLVYGGTAGDNRGFVLGQNEFMDVMQYTRPAWGDGNRQVSIDGKGRRDHQMDMDMLLTKYIHEELQGKPSSHHGNQACFDCHTSHAVGSNVDLQPSGSGGRGHLKVSSDVDGTIRLKDTRENLCGSCHTGTGTELPGNINVATALSRLNGATGWSTFGWPWNGTATWNNEGGRGSAQQHLFNTIVDQSDGSTKVYGLAPSQYVWSTSNTASTTKTDFKAIWPWERALEQATGKTIVYGATPWVK